MKGITNSIGNGTIFIETKSSLESGLNSGAISEKSVVFIKDTKEIWTNGVYFDCKDTSAKLDSSVAASTYATKTELQNYVNSINSLLDQINGD